MDLFAAISTERHRLADILDGLTDEQWTAESCCRGWTVEDVAAHLTVVWHYTAIDYVKGSLRLPKTWFRPRKALAALNETSKDERKSIGRAALIAELRDHADDRSTPTGFGPDAPLTDLVIHIRDICVPLGLMSPSEPAHAVSALNAATSRRFVVFSRRSSLRGLSFAATDVEWTHGKGPLVSGTAVALAHAMWGRAVALDELSGDGVDILRSRLTS